MNHDLFPMIKLRLNKKHLKNKSKSNFVKLLKKLLKKKGKMKPWSYTIINYRNFQLIFSLIKFNKTKL